MKQPLKSFMALPSKGVVSNMAPTSMISWCGKSNEKITGSVQLKSKMVSSFEYHAACKKHNFLFQRSAWKV